MSRIIRLQAENFKRLEAINITPPPGTVIVAGQNAQGKTSVLDAIQAALGGGKAIPEDPIHHGERKAKIVVETEDLVVTRTFSAKGSRLEVRAKDGSKVKSPQTALDSLTHSLSFDPLAFCNMPPAKQRETLRELAGLDTAAHDDRIARAESKRYDANREVKRLAAIVNTSSPHEGIGTEEKSAAELVGEVQRATELQGKAASHEAEATRLRQSARDTMHEIENLVEEAGRLRERLAQIETSVVGARERKAQAEVHAEDEEAKAKGILRKVEAINVDNIKAELEGIEDHNAKARANAELEARTQEMREAARLAENLDDEVKQAREDKARAIAEADYPVDGLALTDDGVEFNGVPFEQASGAEKIKVSSAIGLSMNPDLRVILVRDASLLDENSMTALTQFAAEHDAQIWLEAVGERPDAFIVIEEGRAK